MMPKVYATARRPLARIADPLASRARRRRHERFFALAATARRAARVLDVGCGSLGLRALEPELDITGLDVVAPPGYPGPFVLADPAEGLPFADEEFDLVYCSSVIEHVPPAAVRRSPRELRRVARGWYVQTPAFSFPIEPHSLLPGAHWLPVGLRRRYWRLGVAGSWEEISLLRRGELEAAVRPRPPGALRGAREELGLRQPARRLMSLLIPLMTRNTSRMIPTELKRYIAASEMRRPRTFSATAHRM